MLILALIVIVVATNVALATPPNGDPNIFCTDFQLGCDDPADCTFASSILGPGYFTFAAALSKSMGCWCQSSPTPDNPGIDGPNCPTWLTCPVPMNIPILAIYLLDQQTARTSCHCHCPGQEAPCLDNIPSCH